METTTIHNRLNKPNNLSKTEGEHIAHVIDRLKERFNIMASKEDYYELLELAQSEVITLYRINCSNTVKLLTFKEKEMLVIYGRKTGVNRMNLPARIKTVLFPDMKYTVPDELKKQGIDQENFTKQIADTIEEMNAFAKTIMPTITVRELFTNAKYNDLNPSFKGIVKHLSNNGKYPVRQNLVLRGAIRIVIEKYDKAIVEELAE